VWKRDGREAVARIPHSGAVAIYQRNLMHAPVEIARADPI